MSRQKFDIQKRQKYSFEAAVANSKQANTAILSYQNWLLVLGMAELAFLGSLILKENIGNMFLIKAIIVCLLLGFFCFIFGAQFQHSHSLRKARFYEKISNKALEYIHSGTIFMEKEPSNLALPEKQIQSCFRANILLMIFSGLSLISNIGITILVVLI